MYFVLAYKPRLYSSARSSAQLEWNYCELPIPPLGIVPTGFRGLCHSGRPPSEGVREALYSPPPLLPPSSANPPQSPLLTLSLSPERKRGKKREKSHTGRWKGGGGGRELSLPPILFLRPSHGPFSIPPLSREDVEHGRRRPPPSSACEPCTYTNVVAASFRDALLPLEGWVGGGRRRDLQLCGWETLGERDGRGRCLIFRRGSCTNERKHTYSLQ